MTGRAQKIASIVRILLTPQEGRMLLNTGDAANRMCRLAKYGFTRRRAYRSFGSSAYFARRETSFDFTHPVDRLQEE